VNAVEELAGLRGLARALAHGDADDLLQDAAVAALEHPPATDRSVKPWLATVILNRWRPDGTGSSPSFQPEPS
jgi:DNA-directed RNA polymerase specialized sigma24 family protein